MRAIRTITVGLIAAAALLVGAAATASAGTPWGNSPSTIVSQ
jgi:hypothetical protein